MLEETNKNLLVELDALEEKIKEAKMINDRYEELKKQIKKTMSDIGRENNLEQIKWTTPNGTKITCTIGHSAEFEKETIKELDIEKLKTFFEDVYEACLVEREINKITKNATSDTLRITLGKE